MIIRILDDCVNFVNEIAMYCWCEWNQSIVHEFNLHSQEEVKKDILENTICFVAIDGEELAGFISVCKCDFPSKYKQLTPWIQNFYVVPKYRKNGVGNALFIHALECCVDNGVETVYLWTYEKTKGFYDKHGFVVYDEVSMDDGVRIVMYKNLLEE
jgi:GNAT superfamily N-acetyltransferase